MKNKIQIQIKINTVVLYIRKKWPKAIERPTFFLPQSLKFPVLLLYSRFDSGEYNKKKTELSLL